MAMRGEWCSDSDSRQFHFWVGFVENLQLSSVLWRWSGPHDFNSFRSLRMFRMLRWFRDRVVFGSFVLILRLETTWEHRGAVVFFCPDNVVNLKFTSSTVFVSMSHKYDKLLSWARSNGAIIPNSLTFPSSPYGHCRTTTPIDKGTHLFHIPHTILITPAVASSALPQLKDVCVHARMCAFIALERRKEGFWKDYLDSLPEGFSTPPYFGERELELLKGTNLSFAWRDRIDIWKKEFNEVQSYYRWNWMVSHILLLC